MSSIAEMTRGTSVPIPHYQITYAQNREDLLLAGILRKVECGFYVDVGANHPEADSVTKIFYDKGWSGINIEPHEHLIHELCRQRPRDINIQAGVASQPGTLRLRTYGVSDGLSTFSSDLKKMYESLQAGSAHTETAVEVQSLAEILLRHRPAGHIHFLKIDVEGLELEVLLGNAWERFRPWVVCLERGLNTARRDTIAAFLGAWRYIHVFFDGINDYFVPSERRDLWDGFSYAQEIIIGGIPLHAAFLPLLRESADRLPGPRSTVMARAKNVHELLGLEGEAFVRAAYATFLNRSPDPDGLANCLAELKAGDSKILILSRLRNSAEGQRQNLPLAGFRWAMLCTRMPFASRAFNWKI
jgi:FkbM family methyltransferase